MPLQNDNVLTPMSKDAVEGTIAARFSHVAARLPTAPAVVEADRTWTYADLDTHSERLAVEILRNGPTDQDPILLLFDQMAYAIIAMLACIKIGRPYVPLSQSNPPARTNHIVNDSGATLLVTEPSCREMAADIALAGITILDIEAVAAQDGDTLRLPSASANSLAWILYTSGSTGVPKGVMQNHRNVLHYVRTYAEGQALTQDDRISLVFSYTANIANHDIFSALLTGAAIYPYDVLQSGVGSLADWLEDNRITVFSVVPTLFRHLVQDLPIDLPFRSLRIVKLVGEPVYSRDLDAFRAKFPATCMFINRLGSSETGTIRWFFVDANTQVEGTPVPVGTAVPDHEIHLLDDDGHPVPMCETGEIVVKSRYLSPGYWHRPDLTEKAFTGQGDRRCFRTGDLGQFLPNGGLVHLGRKDLQIKIRGFRIETGEIEAAILQYPGVKNALVMTREDLPGDPRLVAYFTLEAGYREPTVSELRSALEGHLPDYMIPNSFVALDSFPLAPNGKVIRSELPAVGQECPNLTAPYAPPRTPFEHELALLWQELLHVDKVGVHDDFLELGGHSLLATRLISQIQVTLGIELGMRTLFDNPTIESLADIITASREGGGHRIISE